VVCRTSGQVLQCNNLAVKFVVCDLAVALQVGSSTTSDSYLWQVLAVFLQGCIVVVIGKLQDLHQLTDVFFNWIGYRSLCFQGKCYPSISMMH
jgi:uncharacterized protein (DUF983 family)